MVWKIRATLVVFFLGVIVATIRHVSAERKIVCYYTNWSIYRPGTAKFSPQNINPYLCTHLIYAFGGFTKENALKPYDKYQDIEKGGYAKFTGLKTYNKNLKTMLAIGGWNEGSSRFSPMVADPARRREFVKNSVKFLRQHHFDGLDLDWEYPAFRDGGKPRDKDNYASLVQELCEEFDKESSKTGRPRLLLSMAMPAGVEYIDKGYDVPRLDEYLDFINLLSYDYHSAYEPAVNHHSPLYSLEADNEYNYDAELTINYTIDHLMKQGATAEKIILGIPTYGRSYTLFNADATELGSPADGPGTEGDATREKGYLAYYEICESIVDSDGWEVVQPNPKSMGPYAFKANQWVGYDDEGIVRLKAEYANQRSLGGIMFWSIDNDDFRGKCHDRPYPLIEAAKETLLTGKINTIAKTKTVEFREKNRSPVVRQSNSIGKKLGSNRRRTSAAPALERRASTSRSKYRTLSNPKTSEENERRYDSSSEEHKANAVAATDSEKNGRSRPKIKIRPKNRQNSNRRKQTRHKEDEKSTETDNGSLSNRLTTPEPPTTPDPGTDFKCEDEGFFSHPRDCKKYFWCLDSGPGGQGVVAHQFTCPSGLVFNKAADSCDYPRNVICPKSKVSQSVVSTTKAPIVAATSRTTYLYGTTVRTTTKKEESEEDEHEYKDYEDDEDDEQIEEEEEDEEKVDATEPTTSKPLVYKTINRNRPTSTSTTSSSSTASTTSRSELEKVSNDEDEEDPRVIKELIELIKKAGGIEQLEKQLHLQDKTSDANSNNERVSPATISRSLYERVLSQQTNRITSSQRSSSKNNYANGPGGAQFEGLDQVPEVKSLRRSQKPRYVTIERPKSSTKGPRIKDETIEDTEEDEEEEEEGEEEEDVEAEDIDNTDIVSSEELNLSSQRPTLSYVNIRRAQPSVKSSNRNNGYKKNEEETVNQESRTYENEEDAATTKSRYVSVQRFRSTTSRSPVDDSREGSSLLPVPPEELSTTELIPSTETIESTSAASTTSSSTISPLSGNVIVNDLTTERSSSSSIVIVTPESRSSTEYPKLIEDSATEILLTTLPFESGESTLSSSKITVATVSQPRPFGYARRNNRPATSTESATTDRTRSKVNFSKKLGLSSRNLASSGPAARLRKPSLFPSTTTSQESSDTFKNHPKNSPTEKPDIAELATTQTSKPIKDHQVDQTSRAQELAVTFADPPSSSQSSGIGRLPLRNAPRHKISTTVSPRIGTTATRTTLSRQKPRTKPRPSENSTVRPRRPAVIDYDYYEDEEQPVVVRPAANVTLFFTSQGNIRCLDQGNFPHPYSCKKFITCARMVNGKVVGAEYTCPNKLSFDPVGGICNWSAGLGCKE